MEDQDLPDLHSASHRLSGEVFDLEVKVKLSDA